MSQIPGPLKSPKGYTEKYKVNTPEKKQVTGWEQNVPYKIVERYESGLPKGVRDISESVVNGKYDIRYLMPSESIYTDDNGKYYTVLHESDLGRDDLRKMTRGEFKKLLPKRDYIGGSPEEVRVDAVKMIPGLSDYVWNTAKKYNVDPNLVIGRVMNEGFADNVVKVYNEQLTAGDQGESYWSGIWDTPVNGFQNFGLDDAGSHMLEGKYELLDKNASWSDAEADNEHGRTVNTVVADNLKSAIEILAAEMAYRQGMLNNRSYIPKDKLGTYTNAAYRLGLNHKDLMNAGYIEREYSYPDYYTKYGFSHIDDIDSSASENRVLKVAKMIMDSGYEYKCGGSIQKKQFDVGGFVEKYGSDNVLAALNRIRSKQIPTK